VLFDARLTLFATPLTAWVVGVVVALGATVETGGVVEGAAGTAPGIAMVVVVTPVTVCPVVVAVIVGLALSTAVTVWLPGVLKVTLLKRWIPASVAVNV